VGSGLGYAYWRLVFSAPQPTFSWVREGVTYELLDPRAVGILLIAPLLLFGLGRSLADLPWQQRLLSLLLRLTFLALIALGLARLVRTAETEKICTVFLVDVSDSVPPEALDDARAAVQRALEAKSDEDLVKLVTFAQRPRLVELHEQDDKSRVAPAAELRHSAAADPGRPLWKPSAGSDLQAALQLAYGLFPPGYLKRAVLVTDGVETDGDVLAEANRARSFQVRLYTIPDRRPPPGEVAIQQIRMPDKVKTGEPFESTQPGAGTALSGRDPQRVGRCAAAGTEAGIQRVQVQLGGTGRRSGYLRAQA